MDIHFHCPACDAKVTAPADHAGRKAKCAKCSAALTIPAAPAPAPEHVDPHRTPPVRAKPAADSHAGLPPPLSGKPRATPRTETLEPHAVHRRGRGLSNRALVLLVGGAGLATALTAACTLWLTLAPPWGRTAARTAGGDADAAPQASRAKPAKPAEKEDISERYLPASLLEHKPDPEESDPAATKPADPPAPDGAGAKPPAAKPGPPKVYASFQQWLQDFEEAKQKAAAEKKDILIAFDGSDWCGWSIRMAQDVFFQKQFRDRAEEQFLLVFIDFPRKRTAKAQVQDPKRNERLARDFEVDGFPTIILADAEGRPYGRLGHVEGGVEAFFNRLTRFQTVRQRRDELFKEVAEAEGADKIAAARKALKLLREQHFTRHYATTIDQWLDMARQYDADNSQGLHEYFFTESWLSKFRRAAEERETKPEGLAQVVALLTEWKKTHKFQDADMAASLHLHAARMFAVAEQLTEAAEQIKEGLACGPQDAEILADLKEGAAAIRVHGAGTGFVISGDGYLLTNHHVIEGAEKVSVRFPGREEPAPATVVAQDVKRDVALLKIDVPADVTLKPVRIAETDAPRGTKVGAFGFPVTGTVGAGLKLTTGIVSATADPDNDGLCLLDCRINPGNSGGPLCDAYGNVVGMVSAKSVGGFGVESYGMALPASVLRDFLATNLPKARLKPATPTTGQGREWSEIDGLVGPAVMMIVRGG